jgi:hypothetical protein
MSTMHSIGIFPRLLAAYVTHSQIILVIMMYVCIFQTATYVIPHSTIPFPQSSLYIEPCGLKWKEFSDLKLRYHLNNRGTNWREQKWEQLRYCRAVPIRRNQNHSIMS